MRNKKFKKKKAENKERLPMKIDSLGKKVKKRLSSKKIKKITEGLFSNLCDFFLYWLFLLPASSFGKSRSPADIYQMFREADSLHCEINYQSFKNAYRKLREKGLIETIKEWRNKRVATKEGIKRLKSNLPFYDEKRFWDGNLYLVQYDIPRTQNRIRNLLRDWFLKNLGAIALQDSLYLVFLNPQDLLRDFLKDKTNFEGNILISKLNKDGILGEERLEDFIWYKSGLAELNVEYQNFIDKYKKAKKVNRSELFRDYFSILKKDPQIPFELLPDEYLGDEAYLLFLKFFKNTLFNMHVHTK